MHRDHQRLAPTRLDHAPGIDAAVRIAETAGGELRCQFHQVEPGGEVLAMGEEHGTAGFLAALVFTHGQRQVRQHCAVEGVALARAVQADEKQMTALLSGDAARAAVGFAHDASLLCLGWWSGNFF